MKGCMKEERRAGHVPTPQERTPFQPRCWIPLHMFGSESLSGEEYRLFIYSFVVFNTLSVIRTVMNLIHS